MFNETLSIWWQIYIVGSVWGMLTLHAMWRSELPFWIDKGISFLNSIRIEDPPFYTYTEKIIMEALNQFPLGKYISVKDITPPSYDGIVIKLSTENDSIKYSVSASQLAYLKTSFEQCLIDLAISNYIKLVTTIAPQS